MKSIWSKVGQAHHCGCHACKTAVHGAGRRVTTASRRKVTFAEIFTAAYSSVFASAAVVDAIHKDDRRKDLDRQLDEARRDLAELKERNRTIPEHDQTHDSVESSIANLTSDQMNELWSTLRLFYTHRPYYKEIHKPATLRDSELRQKLQREHYGCPDSNSVKTTRRSDLERLQQAMLIEESDSSIQQTDPRGQEQMEHLTRGMAGLVGNMMYRVGAKADEFSMPSPSFDAAHKLLEEGYPHYSFPQVDPESARENVKNLNRANRSIINDKRIRMKEKVGKVCCNLLLSRFPLSSRSVS